MITFEYSYFSDPNLNRNGTEGDIRLLERTFIDTHGFDLDLNLQETVNVQQVTSGMNNFVNQLPKDTKFVTIVIMSHGKKHNW